MNSESIHPRVQNGKTKFEKVNTTRRKSAYVLEGKIARMTKHGDEHPNDKASAAHKAKLVAALPSAWRQ